MRKARSPILLLGVALGALTFSHSAWLPSEVGQGREAGELPAATEKTDAQLGGNAETVVMASPASSRRDDSQDDCTAESLSADASVLVAAMCDLQLMAADADLPLDEKDWPTFASVVVRNQAIQHTYEARIATVQKVAPGLYRAEIPAYAGVGEELRERFAADLRAELGESMAGEVLAKLGARLEARFAGFGLSVQTLDITADPVSGADEVQIARSSTYWDGTSERGRLTTRREIHFPLLEDPTGDSWSALMAKVNAAGAES